MATLVSSQNLNQNILLKNVFESEKSPKETNEDKIKSFLEKVLTREDVTERLLAAMQPIEVEGKKFSKTTMQGWMEFTKRIEVIPGIYPLEKEDYKVFIQYMLDITPALLKGDNDKTIKDLEEKFHGDVTWGALWWTKDHSSSAGLLLSWIGEACAEKGLPKLGIMMRAIGAKLIGKDTPFYNLENIKVELEKIREELRPLQERRKTIKELGFTFRDTAKKAFRLQELENEELKKVALEHKLESISETIKEAIDSCCLEDLEEDESYRRALSTLGIPSDKEPQEKLRAQQTKMRVRPLG